MMKYLVDKPDDGKKVEKGIHLGRLGREDLARWIGKGSESDTKRLVLVSGPEGYAIHVTGLMCVN